LRRIQQAGFLVPCCLTTYLWLKGHHPALPGWTCPLRALTGIPCPTCFLTRATSLALQADLAGSVQTHAFGPLVALGLVGWSLLAIRQRRLLPRWPLPWPSPRHHPGLLAALALALLAYWAGRLALRLI
jgi:Protein of unknown function (DUF2752)